MNDCLDDNPYRPPDSQGAAHDRPVDGSVDADRTGHGSWIRVGPRRRFDGPWMWQELRRSIWMTLMWGALTALAFAGLDIGSDTQFLVALGVSVGILIACMPLVMGFRRASTELRREAPGCPGSEFFVSLSLDPRLGGSRAETLDLADDVGVVELLGDVLRYRGDRVELDLDRRDVEAVRSTYTGPNGRCLIFSPDTYLDLREPLLDRHRVRLGLREGRTVIHALPRGRALASALRAWSGAGGTTRSDG